MVSYCACTGRCTPKVTVQTAVAVALAVAVADAEELAEADATACAVGVMRGPEFETVSACAVADSTAVQLAVENADATAV